MGNTAENVSVGKPKVSGGIWRAPLGTALPTDASSELTTAFKSVGYVSEDGVKHHIGLTATNFRAWGGDVVHSATTEREETFAFGLIESLNKDTYEITNGAANVSGSLEAGITVRSNSSELDEYVYVIEMMLRAGAMKRIVIPRGKVTEIGDVTYADATLISFPITITALAGSDGDNSKQYIYRPATQG